MRFCLCALARARLFMIYNTYYIFLELYIHIICFLNLLDSSHRLRLNLAFYDDLDFLAFFSPKFDDVLILGFCSYAIPNVL